jgi:hypothetical protein
VSTSGGVPTLVGCNTSGTEVLWPYVINEIVPVIPFVPPNVSNASNTSLPVPIPTPPPTHAIFSNTLSQSLSYTSLGLGIVGGLMGGNPGGPGIWISLNLIDLARTLPLVSQKNKALKSYLMSLDSFDFTFGVFDYLTLLTLEDTDQGNRTCGELY